jgi:hypothetical protein
MIKSGVNCEARQARHAIVLEQNLDNLRFKRYKIAAIDVDEGMTSETERVKVREWLKYARSSSSKRVSSGIEKAYGETSPQVGGGGGGGSSSSSSSSSKHTGSDVNPKREADHGGHTAASGGGAAGGGGGVSPAIREAYGVSNQAQMSMVQEQAAARRETKKGALAMLDGTIAELNQAILRIRSPVDLRPKLVGIVLRQGVWIGYTATVLSSLLYGLTQFVMQQSDGSVPQARHPHCSPW